MNTTLAARPARLAVLALLAAATAPAHAIDTQKPVLTQVDVLTTTVDASKRDAYVDVRITATDNDSGLYEGVVRLIGPGPATATSQVNVIEQNFVFGGGRSQTFTIRVGAPRYNGYVTRYFDVNTIPGEWKLDFVRLRDRANNYADYEAADGALAAVPGAKTFTVANRLHDIRGPKLITARVLTPTVDLAREYPQARVSMEIVDEGSPNPIGSDLVTLEFCKLPVYYLPSGSVQCADRIKVEGSVPARSRTVTYSGPWRSELDNSRAPAEGRYCPWLLQIRDVTIANFSETFTGRPQTDPNFPNSLLDDFTSTRPRTGGALAPPAGYGVFAQGSECIDVVDSRRR